MERLFYIDIVIHRIGEPDDDRTICPSVCTDGRVTGKIYTLLQFLDDSFLIELISCVCVFRLNSIS
jgi:hypothetical protein